MCLCRMNDENDMLPRINKILSNVKMVNGSSSIIVIHVMPLFSLLKKKNPIDFIVFNLAHDETNTMPSDKTQGKYRQNSENHSFVVVVVVEKAVLSKNSQMNRILISMMKLRMENNTISLMKTHNTPHNSGASNSSKNG